jgi:SSS family solute:Na+ symporter
LLLFSIIVYLVLTIAIGYWASKRVKTSGDFMLAGRSLPVLLSSAALFATWFGSETVFGASAEFMHGGLYAVIEDPFGSALCLVLFGVFLARRLYNMNLLTLGDYFEVRFGKRTELVACAFLAFPYVGYQAAQLVAMGLILNVIAGLALWQGVVISAVIVTFYTYIGGMWAISITDFFQSIIITIGLIVLSIVLANKAGGAMNVISAVPEHTFKFFPDASLKDIIAWLAAWCVMGLGSLPSQDVFQRAMSSSSAKTAVRSCYIAAGLYLTIAMLPLFISLCTKHLYPNQVGDPQLALPNMVIAHTGIVVQVLFFGSLLSAIMSTTSSAILAPAVILAENLIRPLSKRQYNDTQMLSLTRISVLIFSAIATTMACLRSNIYELVAESSILSLVSLFVPLMFGLYWKKASSTGAILSILGGGIAWLIFLNVELSIPALVPCTIISAVGMIGGSLLFPGKQVSAV